MRVVSEREAKDNKQRMWMKDLIRDSFPVDHNECVYFTSLEPNPKWNHLSVPIPTLPIMLLDSVFSFLFLVNAHIVQATCLQFEGLKRFYLLACNEGSPLVLVVANYILYIWTKSLCKKDMLQEIISQTFWVECSVVWLFQHKIIEWFSLLFHPCQNKITYLYCHFSSPGC